MDWPDGFAGPDGLARWIGQMDWPDGFAGPNGLANWSWNKPWVTHLSLWFNQ